METKTRNKVYPLAMTAVMAAVICVLGPLSIPVGPVSYTHLLTGDSSPSQTYRTPGSW